MKKPVLIFDYEKMQKAGQYINSIQVIGVNNIRMMSELSYILDSGTLSEIEVEEPKEREQEPSESKEVKADETD